MLNNLHEKLLESNVYIAFMEQVPRHLFIYLKYCHPMMAGEEDDR